MHSQVHSHMETAASIPSLSSNGSVADCFVPSTFQDDFFGDLVYEYLPHRASWAPGPYHWEWPAYSPMIDCTYIDFITSFPLMDNASISPATHWSPLPQDPPSPQRSRELASQLSCSEATPEFSNVRKRWYCSVCEVVFRDKYQCGRHIRNAGKRAKCLACGKNVCARRDNRKRHYAKYCKRVYLGVYTDLRFEDAFVDV